MSGSASNTFNTHPPFEFESQPGPGISPNKEPKTGAQPTLDFLPLAPETEAAWSIDTSSLLGHNSLDENGGMQLAPPVTGASNFGTLNQTGPRSGTIFRLGGESTTLNQLAGQQPIESTVKHQVSGPGPGNLPRTPLIPSNLSDTVLIPGTLSDTPPSLIPGNLPRTPIVPGAYPNKESPLEYPPLFCYPWAGDEYAAECGWDYASCGRDDVWCG